MLLEGLCRETTQWDQEPSCSSSQLLESSSPRQQTRERKSICDAPSCSHLTAVAWDTDTPSKSCLAEPRHLKTMRGNDKMIATVLSIMFCMVCYAAIDNQYIGLLLSDFVSSKAKVWKSANFPREGRPAGRGCRQVKRPELKFLFFLTYHLGLFSQPYGLQFP